MFIWLVNLKLSQRSLSVGRYKWHCQSLQTIHFKLEGPELLKSKGRESFGRPLDIYPVKSALN